MDEYAPDDAIYPPRAEHDTSDWTDRPMDAEEAERLQAALAHEEPRDGLRLLYRLARDLQFARDLGRADIPVVQVVPGGGMHGERWNAALLGITFDAHDFVVRTPDDVRSYEPGAGEPGVGDGTGIYDHAPTREELQRGMDVTWGRSRLGNTPYKDGSVPYFEVPAGQPEAIIAGVMNLSDGTRSRFQLPVNQDLLAPRW